MRTYIRILVIVLLLAPLTVTSTPPTPGPWHQFYLSGFLKSESDASVANYTVAAMQHTRGSWKMVHSCRVAIADDYGGANDLYLTNGFGRFNLSIWCCSPPESVAAAIVLPDTILMGKAIFPGALNRTVHSGTYKVKRDGFLCDDSETRYRDDGYLYDVDSLVVPVP